MKRNLLYIMGVVCMMTSCIEEQNVIEIVPTPGKDVLFSAELGTDAKTRTLYGVDNTSAIKVNWVKDDLIAVFGEDCTNKQAVYSVNVSVDATPNGEGQNYADKLVKNGAAGVQWGEDGISDFYAVYPSTNAKFNTNIDSNGKVKVTSISTSISSTQNYVFNNTIDDDDVWRGTSFGNDATKPSMQNAVMFAYTKDATSVYYNEDGTVYIDEEGNTVAKPVDLHFKPFSTVFKFRFEGFSYDFEDAVTNQTVYVQSIVVTAPSGVKLAGDFDITNFAKSGNTATASASTEGKTTTNTVTINTILPTGGYLPVQADQAVEFNVFAIPQNYSMTTTTPWKVTINASVAGTNQSYTYTMIPTVEGGYSIAAGQIHKLSIPAYTISTPPVWDPSKWIEQIPEKVYLSELSFPGAWYCMDTGYQGTSIGLGNDELTYITNKTVDENGTVTSWYSTSEGSNGIDDGLENMFYHGIRAFNIDCRITRNKFSDRGLGTNPPHPWTETSYENNQFHFACSGTEQPSTYSVFYWQTGMTEGTYVKDAVSDIVTLAKAYPNEIIAIIFTFAEKPCTESGGLGGALQYGTTDPRYISEQLSAVLNDDTISPYIYTGIDSSTTIEDIISSKKNIIVKINHSNSTFYNGSTFTMPSGIMASYASMAMTDWGNSYNNYISELPDNYYSSHNQSEIYNGKISNKMTYHYHQAQRTESSTTVSGTTYPSIFDRMNAITAILEEATSVYDNSEHNALFQLGIGGVLENPGQNQTMASLINPLVLQHIQDKMNNDPSPVGFVLMNEALNSTYGLPLVNKIIEMNGSFYLKREGGDITTGDTTTSGGEDEGDTGEW